MGFEWTAAGLATSARRDAAGAALGRIMHLPMDERRGPLFSELFARAAAPVMQRDLAPIIDHVRPDVMLRETAELAAVPMAAVRGIPLVTVAFSGVLPERARGEVLDALRPLWQAEGLGDPSWSDLYGQLYLHPFPVSFGQRPDSPIVRPIRPEPGSPSVEVAGWVAALGVERPFVYVTSGTEPPAVTFPWRELFAAFDDLAVDAVATIGPHVDPDALGAVPANVRVERFVPQADLLGRATAVVSHGGAGTVLGTASHGRPQLVVPLFADQWENGIAVNDAGCGIVLGPTERSIGGPRAGVGHARRICRRRRHSGRRRSRCDADSERSRPRGTSPPDHHPERRAHASAQSRDRRRRALGATDDTSAPSRPVPDSGREAHLLTHVVQHEPV